MRKIGKENVIVVCTIVLCFMLTLGLCVMFSGDGIVSVFSPQKVKAENVYAIAIGGYKDMTLARASADLIKKRGGAGYVCSNDDGIEIVYAVYKNDSDAQSVLSRLGDKGAYVKEISIDEGKFSWCDKQLRSSVKNALRYYDISFSALYSTADSLNSNEINLNDAKTQIQVLKSQIEDIKSVFYKDVENCADEQITQIKLALVTCLALLDNIELNATVADATSSIRYQLTQLVFCRQALMSAI